MPEIVYLLTNPSMPSLVKVGRTSNLEDRLRSLSSHSGVPVPFEVFYACEVKDSSKVEQSIHDAFGDHRVNPKREFFRINPERVLAILKLLELKDVTPVEDLVEDSVEQDALDRERSRRENFRFSMINIQPESQLTFVRDDSLVARVINDRQIEFEGSVTSLSSSAVKILQSRYGYRGSKIQGPQYWCYEGRVLSEIRDSIEGEAVE